jgi:N-acetylmuramoyl-L-alanine amidase
MIEQLADDVRMVTTPARTAHLYVLGSRAMPSALLEMGFLSNRQDESLLRQSAHRHHFLCHANGAGHLIDRHCQRISDQD